MYKYLNDQLSTFPQPELTLKEKRLMNDGHVGEYILRKLMTQRFRTKAISCILMDEIVRKVTKSVKNGKPIYLTVPFGGYKLWKYPTFPNLDWAEVFNIIQLRNYLAPIVAVYRPGVVLEYWSDEIMVSRTNNYPQTDLDRYNGQFSDLIAWWRGYLPENFQVRYSKIRDQISYDEYWRRMKADLKKVEGDWENLSEEIKNVRMKKSERNYHGNLNEKNKEVLLKDGALCHDAFIFGDWKKDIPWAFDDHMIALGFRYTGDWGIPVKSSQSSVCQFWVGIGVLKKREDRYVKSILTHSQWEKVCDQVKYCDVGLFPTEFKSLQKIPVLKE